MKKKAKRKAEEDKFEDIEDEIENAMNDVEEQDEEVDLEAEKEVEEPEESAVVEETKEDVEDTPAENNEEAELVEVVEEGKKKVPFFKFDNNAYMSYERKVLIYLILVLGCAILSTIFLTRSFSTGKQEHISYREQSSLDYKVYLKKNDFYETKYLDKDMVYVASLIKRIDVNIKYLFDIDEKSNINFDYDIIGKLAITDNDEKDVFFEKEYTLLENKKDGMKDSKNYGINENVSINYDYYNNLTNKFRSDYGIETKSNLIIYFKVNQKSAEDNKYKLDTNSTMSLTIPLSEKAINIKMDTKEINKESQLYRVTAVVVSNYIYAIVSVILIIVLAIFIGPLIKLLLNMRTKKSTYDKYVERVLNEYDRLIVETTTPPNMNVNNIVRVHSFTELLDVRDNLSLPIKYYVINNHQKCNFYINHGDELYLLVLKAVDIEEKNKK